MEFNYTITNYILNNGDETNECSGGKITFDIVCQNNYSWLIFKKTNLI